MNRRESRDLDTPDRIAVERHAVIFGNAHAGPIDRVPRLGSRKRSNAVVCEAPRHRFSPSGSIHHGGHRVSANVVFPRIDPLRPSPRDVRSFETDVPGPNLENAAERTVPPDAARSIASPSVTTGMCLVFGTRGGVSPTDFAVRAGVGRFVRKVSAHVRQSRQSLPPPARSLPRHDGDVIIGTFRRDPRRTQPIECTDAASDRHRFGWHWTGIGPGGIGPASVRVASDVDPRCGKIASRRFASLEENEL